MKRSIGRMIAQKYEQRRLQAEQERDRRIAAVHAAHPELARIDQELAVAGADLLLEAMEPGRPRQAGTQLAEWRSQRAQYLARHKIDPSFDQLAYTCQACQDTGRIGSQRCSCYQAMLVPLLTEEANLAALQHMTFDHFDAGLFSDQADPARYQSDISPRRQILGLRSVAGRFVDRFSQPETRSMLFIGKPGTGKTFLMVSIAHALLQKGYSVLYLTAPQLFDLLQENRILLSSYNPDPIRLEHSTAMKDSILNCDLLLIDDLGTEAGAAARYADLLAVIDGRQAPGRKMIISSNADPASLRDHYDERLLSRLVGGFSVYRFFGDDIRLAANRRRRP